MRNVKFILAAVAILLTGAVAAGLAARAVTAPDTAEVRSAGTVSIPAVLGSALLTLVKAFASGTIVWSNIPAYLVGMAVAGVTGYFALVFLKKMVMSGNAFSKFAYYCWGAGIVSLILSLFLE